MAMELMATRRWGRRGLLPACLLLPCLACLASMAMAQEAAPAPAQEVAPAVTASVAAPAAVVSQGFDWRGVRSVLFRVRSPQPGAADNLVLGTIHIGTPAELGLDDERVRAAVRARRTLINEVDGDTPWLPRYDRYRFLAPEQSLAMLIGGTQFIELLTLLPEYDGQQLNRFKPWVAMTLLEQGLDRSDPGDTNPARRNLDTVVENTAREQGLRLVHLETMEDQLAALDCTTPQEYAPVLSQRLADPQELRAETERALGFYRAGDLAGWLADLDVLRGLDASARQAEQRARDCLIEQRNARWIEELEPLLLEGDCFVAIGAIHLAGDNGLLAGLARRGFEVSVQAW